MCSSFCESPWATLIAVSGSPLATRPSISESRFDRYRAFLLAHRSPKAVKGRSSRDKLSLHTSGFKTRSLGHYAFDAFSRMPCADISSTRHIPRRGIKSCLDRDITEQRSSFGGFTVAIIPINRAPFQPPLGLGLRAQVPPADQSPRRGFWAALHSSKTLSASHTFPESVTTVSQIPISGLTSHQRHSRRC